MMRRVVWAETTQSDLRGIATYIGRQNVHAARRLIAALRHAGRSLGEHPSGRIGRVDGTFEKVVQRTPYILVYEMRTTASGEAVIAILRVIHAARDWPEGHLPPQE